MNWAAEEFGDVDLGDKRLNSRLVKLCDSFSGSPESPINQACADWAETKAAYRFFRNKNVDVNRITKAHRKKTSERIAGHHIVLALQDTSYLIYTNHSKTRGLGKLSLKKGKNIDKIYSYGLVMHTCLAVTTEGTPLGIIDQKIFARQSRSESALYNVGGKKIHDTLPVEEKESYRWIESLETTMKVSDKTRIVTVCDRECDFYDFFQFAQRNGATVLIRASQNRIVNKSSRYSEISGLKLWDHILSKPTAGTYTIDISTQQKNRHCKGRKSRLAHMEVKHCHFTMNPPRNHPKHKTEALPDIDLYAINALEKNPPEGEKAIEWMLITNQPTTTFAEACVCVQWYALRWRIEMFFKVLKSGFQVEKCRLGSADRLICYLTVMSIVAWRLFMITLIARTNPSTPCSEFLSKLEWTILVVKSTNDVCPLKTPTIAEMLIEIAKLGGYLDRKNDGPPGTLVLWRGWKRLMDITEGWTMALRSENICG